MDMRFGDALSPNCLNRPTWYLNLMNIHTAMPERRPYAATANVMAVLKRVRTRNLPERIGGEFYTLAGVGTAVHGRVTQALTFLGLVDESGYPQDALRAMAQAPEAEFLELLGACVRERYAAEFQIVDPGQDSQPQILDAFRKYEPRSQTDRMVMLFLGLCREAGMKVKDVPRERQMASSAKAPHPRPGTTSPRLTVQKRSAGRSGRLPTQEATAPGLLFGVSVADIQMLDDTEFDEVWSALGKVARARGRAATDTTTPGPEEAHPEVDEQEGT